MCSSSLEVLNELGSRQDRLGLLERLNFLIPGCLADLEILHDEIAILVELSIVIGEFLQLKEGCLLIGDGLLQILLCLGLLLSLVDLGFGLLFNGGIGVLDKFLIRCLAFSLSTSGISFHLLGIESLDDVQRRCQKLLRGTLISHNLLELLVLLLTLFTSTLQLHVELSDLRLKSVNLRSQSLDGQVEILNKGEEIFLFTVLALSLKLVGVELLNAEVLVLDLILLLSQKLSDHVINGLLDTDEGIKLHFDGNGSKAWAVVFQGNSLQDLGSSSAALIALLLLNECWVEGLGEEVMGLIRAQHGKSFGACLHLELASFLALLPLGISAGAFLFQHHEESLILSEGCLGVIKVLLGLSKLLISVSKFLSLGLRLFLSGNNLILLCCLELLIRLHIGCLILLGFRQILFEAFLHLVQNAKNLT